MARLADREQFDGDREFFVLNKPIRYNGKDYPPGQPFPKTLCTTRKLRLLYEQHWIGMTAATNAYDYVYQSPTAKFDVMSMSELSDYLREHGVVPRSVWDRTTLMQKIVALNESVAA